MAIAARLSAEQETGELAHADRDERLVVIIPAYNEERFIGSVVLRARRFTGTVLVIDDGSTDATAETAEAAGALVVQHTRNRGKGAALSSGFQRALEFGPDAVVAIDADGQHLPEEIPLVAAPVLNHEADIVVGSRYLAKRSDVPRLRIWGHRAFNLLNRGACGISVSDSQSGFRAFSPRALRAMSLHSRGFSVESEMQFVASERNLKVVEVPIVIQYRDRPKRPVVAHGLQVLNGTLRLVGQYRPLLFLGIPGAVLLLAGIVWGFLVIDIYRATRELAGGYAMVAVMLAILGTIALSTGVILHSVRGLLLDLIGRKDA